MWCENIFNNLVVKQPLEASLTKIEVSEEKEVQEYVKFLKASKKVLMPIQQYEALDFSLNASNPLNPYVEELPTLELKPFPSHLKYTNLGESSTLSMIISSSLSKEQERKLLAALEV